MSQQETLGKQESTYTWAALAILVLTLIACYWNTLAKVITHWDDPRYSHGWLIPAFTLVLLWMRREPLKPVSNSARWIGAAVICGSLFLRLGATYFPFITIDMFSFVPAVIGAVLLCGGWAMLRWAAAPVAFMFFMFPLPMFMDRLLLNPLQKIATVCSTYALQTMGVGAFRDGNRISIGEDFQLGVIDACAGLRMLTIFVAMAVAIALVIDRPLWQRIVIIFPSSFIIAILVNVIRITMTAVLYLMDRGELADKLVHDWAGYLMMPLALGFLYLEMQVLSRLLIEEEDGPPVPLTIGSGA